MILRRTIARRGTEDQSVASEVAAMAAVRFFAVNGRRGGRRGHVQVRAIIHLPRGGGPRTGTPGWSSIVAGELVDLFGCAPLDNDEMATFRRVR